MNRRLHESRPGDAGRAGGGVGHGDYRDMRRSRRRRSFVDGIYKHYLGKESKGPPLSSDAEIRRYFAPPLSDAIVKDFAAAHKAGEVPLLNGDPFIDAQDWEISNLKTAVKSTGTNTAVATVTFVDVHEAAHGDARTRQHAGRLADHRDPAGRTARCARSTS